MSGFLVGLRSDFGLVVVGCPDCWILGFGLLLVSDSWFWVLSIWGFGVFECSCRIILGSWAFQFVECWFSHAPIVGLLVLVPPYCWIGGLWGLSYCWN